MGSQGDAGQFRTPRHIIDFIVSVIDPQKDETILDPACGTAGFLISAYTHIIQSNDDLSTEEKTKLFDNMAGYDISPDMVKLSKVNMYLHGFPLPDITEYDTLTEKGYWKDKYDVILANPPFMTPKGGIQPHGDFSIEANRSEVLFVDYIAEHLKKNGRAGVIVPEGIIFQTSNAYKKLRQMLIEENYLYAVISLPSGVFNPYSGVKTSILLMDRKLSKKTSNIFFVKINNDGFNLGAQRREIKDNDLPQTIEILNRYKQAILLGEEFELSDHEKEFAIIASKGEILNRDYMLDGERYRKIEVNKNIEWDLVELRDLVTFKNGLWKGKKEPLQITKIIRNTNIGKNGELKLSDVAVHPVEVKALESRKLEYGDIILENSGGGPTQPVGRVVYFDVTNGETYSWSNFTSRIRTNDSLLIDSKYLYLILNYFYQSGGTELLQKRTSGIRNLDKKAYAQIKIPLPPLSIQQEIVESIEANQIIIDGAKMVVDNYKPIIKIDPEWEMVELGEVCEILNGYAFKSSEYTENGIQIVKMGNVEKGNLNLHKNKTYYPLEKRDDLEKYIIEKNDILISMTGTQGKEDFGNVCLVNVDEPLFLNQRVGKFIVQSNAINLTYLYLSLQSDSFRKQVFKNASGVRQGNISKGKLKRIKIPLPPLSVQEEIVKEIEEEQRIISLNKKLIKIYEQKIDDKIAAVWRE